MLVFVDETSTNISLTRKYGRAPKGERAIGKVPRNWGSPTTLVAGLSGKGVGAPMMLEGAMDTAAFVVYVREVLAPELSPGQVVVMDNLSVHKARAVEELIEARGCQLLFLPAYSPDLSPIELAFSKIKEFLRAAGARTQAALEEAIAQAIETVTAADAEGFFRHCGYRPLAQLP